MTGKLNTWFKSRLNYLGTRMSELDLVNIAYYKGGYDPYVNPLLITAQVGRSNVDMIMDTASMVGSYTRDYFIFSEDLLFREEGQILPRRFKPEEGDVIFDDAYREFYCRVSTINSMAHYKATNETMVRLRVRTSVIYRGEEEIVVPDQVATWLRVDAVPMSRGMKPEDWHPQFPQDQP